MEDSSPLIVPRQKSFSMALAEDEHAFFMHMANTLGVSLSAIVRDAAFASLMSGSDSEALHTARNNSVTSMARVSKWRKQRAPAQPVAAPAQPPRIPLI